MHCPAHNPLCHSSLFFAFKKPKHFCLAGCSDLLLRQLVRQTKKATCREMQWASAAGAFVIAEECSAASEASVLPQDQAGLSTDATRSIAIADVPSAPRIIAPGAADPCGPLPTLCAPRVTSFASPPTQKSVITDLGIILPLGSCCTLAAPRAALAELFHSAG